jgi:hypothetical protein
MNEVRTLQEDVTESALATSTTMRSKHAKNITHLSRHKNGESPGTMPAGNPALHIDKPILEPS